MPGGEEIAFGGHLAAQALVVAREVEPVWSPHAIHSIFLGPARAGIPVVHRIEPLKTGRAFSVVRIETWQNGARCLSSTISFHRNESAPQHQLAMPDHTPPEACPLSGYIPPNTNPEVRRCFEIREERTLPSAYVEHHPRQVYWLRARQDLGADQAIHSAALVWFSDLSMPWTTDLPYTEADGLWAGASLDHSVWFHRPFRADQWLLFTQESVVYAGARALTRGLFFTESGELAATATQETLVRRTAPAAAPPDCPPPDRKGA